MSSGGATCRDHSQTSQTGLLQESPTKDVTFSVCTFGERAGQESLLFYIMAQSMLESG
jgi:hypothetical protein